MYVNPYDNLSGGRWIRTNFHTHAGTGAGTCGRNPVDAVAALYRELGYGALCLSNHDLYTDASAYSDGKMTLLDGVEYSPRSHMLTVGIRRSLHELEHQPAIDETRKDGGFVILCHPNWQHKEYWPWADMDRLTGYLGIEIINQLIYRLSGSGLATDAWDHLLSSGRLVYGFGNDDFHLELDLRPLLCLSGYPGGCRGRTVYRLDRPRARVPGPRRRGHPHRPGAAYEKQLRRHLHLPVCHRRRAVCGCRHRTGGPLHPHRGKLWPGRSHRGKRGDALYPAGLRSGPLAAGLSPQRG